MDLRNSKHQLVKVIFLSLSSVVLLFSTVSAETISSKVNLIVDLLNGIFRTIDRQAAIQLAGRRNDLPNQILGYQSSINEPLKSAESEIRANIKDNKLATGRPGVSLAPTKEVMMSFVNPAVDATYNLTFESLRAAGLSPYLTEVDHIVTVLGEFLGEAGGDDPGTGDPTPTPTPTPCYKCLRFDPGAPPTMRSGGGAEPPTADLIKAINLLKADALQIRSGAASIGNYQVKGASSAKELAQNIARVQSQLQAMSGLHTIVSGAVEGLIDGLSRLLERGADMSQRPDYYNQGYTDDLVDRANQLLQTDARTRLTDEAEFLDFVRGELEVALQSIVKKQGDEPGRMAYQIAEELLPKVAERIADAESAVGGLADVASASRAKAEEYWSKEFRHKVRHCYHEDSASALIRPIYNMADEFKNLGTPRYLLTQLNNDLAGDLLDTVIAEDILLNQQTAERIAFFAQGAAEIYPDLGSSPLPGIPQMRFSQECGNYVPDPNSSVLVSADPSLIARNMARISKRARKLARELKRRKTRGAVDCAPSDAKCLKQVKRIERKRKQKVKVKKSVNKYAKRFRKELPANLNRAYFNLYGKYPQTPFR